MAVTYITLEEMRDRLQLPQPDDDGIRAAIAAAQVMIDRFCNAAPHGLASATVTETHRGRGTARLHPFRPKISAVTSCTLNGSPIDVEIWDEQSIARTSGEIFPEGSKIVLTYTAGHNPVPQDVKLAALLTAQAVYTAPNFDPNLVSQNIEGLMSGQGHQGGVGSLPPSAMSLLMGVRWVTPF